MKNKPIIITISNFPIIWLVIWLLRRIIRKIAAKAAARKEAKRAAKTAVKTGPAADKPERTEKAGDAR